MTCATFSPGRLAGRVRAPGSKSYTHRAVVAAHLADAPTEIRSPLVSDDTLRTVAAVRALGSRVRVGRNVWTVSPRARRPRGRTRIDCGESGTTARFAAALAALGSSPVVLRASGRLGARPMVPLVDALRSLGARAAFARSSASFPLTISGPIHGGEVEVASGESSQFTSALLLTLPTTREDSVLRLTGRPVSEPYVAATLATMRARGVEARRGRRRFLVPGGQRYRGGKVEVPGDASSAAYLWAGAAVTRGSVAVDGISPLWPQADLAVLELLRRYGARVVRSGNTVRVRGGERRAFRFDLDDTPDLLPLAGALAAAAEGRSVLRGAAHAAAKESDRRTETARLARAMGAEAAVTKDRIVVDGSARVPPYRLRGIRDHRLLMSGAVGALAATGPVRLDDAGCVAKSFPGFFEVWSRLGGEVTIA